MECVLLTGGGSRRMGVDKASLVVDGERQDVRLARMLGTNGKRVTVLGQSPVEGAEFQRDTVSLAGPLASLRGFVPQEALVFVASCDLVCFHSFVPAGLAELLRPDSWAAVPVLEGRLQPFCGVYRPEAFELLRQNEALVRAMGWLAEMPCQAVTEAELSLAGINPKWICSANTPVEFDRLAT